MGRNKMFSGGSRMRPALLLAAALFGLTLSASADDVLPGSDLFTTPPLTSFDAHFTVMPIPAGFFGPGSDPFDRAIPFQGQPLNTNPPGILGPTDVIVARQAPALLPSWPSNSTIPIEIVALNLVSVAPITVTSNGGLSSSFWDVQVNLSSVIPQPQGSMTIFHTQANGGTFNSTLPVQAKFTFTEVGNPSNVRVLDGLPPIPFNSTNSDWVHAVPPPYFPITAPPGVAVDHDGDPGTPMVPVPPSSNFAAGWRTEGANCANPIGCGTGKKLTEEEEQLAAHGVLPPQRQVPPEGEGACCLPDGGCMVSTPLFCQQCGGQFKGFFTLCEGDLNGNGRDDACEPPDPCRPPAGLDQLETRAFIQANVMGQPLSLVLDGPTVVRRGDPMWPVIETEILQLDLSGGSPLGPANLRPVPGTRHLGQVLPSGPGDPNFDSFFDVFTELSIGGDVLVVGHPNPALPGGIQADPVHVASTLPCLPPPPGSSFDTDSTFRPVPLTSRRTGQIVGQLISVRHVILPPRPNHYKTWRVFTDTVQRRVQVQDQFMQDILTLDSVDFLSNPTRKITFNAAGADTFNVVDTTDHLTWYRARGRDTLLAVDFQNQFERDTVIIDAVQYLLLPTQKFPHNPPNQLDHYKAYRIRNPEPFKLPVELQDQFDLQDPRGPERIDSLVPRYFLTPARKNAEPVFDTVTHYVAYEINPKRPVAIIRDTKDQFVIHAMRIDSSVLLLVPTNKIKAFPPPQKEEACCFTGAAGNLVCALVPVGQCAALGGTVVPACLGDGNGNGVDDACDGPPTTGPNHFKTWRVLQQDQVVTRQVIVTDQLMQDNLVLDTIKYLSNPTRKTVFAPTGPVTFPVLDTTDHLAWYGARGRDTLLGIEFQNQFGRDTVNIDRVKFLLIPTRKFPHLPPNRLDHYKAYRIRSAKTLRQPIELEDQFDRMGPPPILPERIDSLVERYFLTPAQKQRPGLPAEPVFDTVTHYVAYQIYPTRRVPHIRDLEDQFGVHVVQIDSAEFLLVPTRKLKVIFPPPPEEACCLPNGTCVIVPAGQCGPVFGGTVVPACLGDLNGNGKDDACEPPPPPVVCCDSIKVPNCLVMCPESDVPYTIQVRDCFGNPIGGYPASQMWLDFSQCPNICPCPEQALPPWPRVFPNGPSDANGNATWYIDAGLRCPSPVPCVVTLCIVFQTPTGPDTCCYPITNVRSTDTNCNLVVEQTDFQFGDATCSDFNCDGIIDPRDKDFWAQHLGHHCVPCDQFREEIKLLGCDETKLQAGDTCQVCVIIHNNTPDTCCLDSLVYQFAGFNATSGGWNTFCRQIFGGAVPKPCIPPGVTDTFCCTYVIPAAGHGCVRILKFSECCNDTVQRNLNADDDPFNCGKICDTFRVPIQLPPGAVWCIVPVENLPPGWTASYSPALSVSPPTCFPAPGPGVITVVICTDDNPVKGQQGCVTLVVTDPAGSVVGKATVCKKIACKLGDLNDDGVLTSSDVVLNLNLTFLGLLPPGRPRCADMNGDGVQTSSDVVLALNATFLGLPPRPGCR